VTIDGPDATVARNVLREEFGEVVPDMAEGETYTGTLQRWDDDGFVLDAGFGNAVRIAAENLELGRGSPEQVRKRFGLVQHMPLRFVNEDPARLADDEVDRLYEWTRGDGRVNVNSATRAEVRATVNRAGHAQDIVTVERIGLPRTEYRLRRGDRPAGTVGEYRGVPPRRTALRRSMRATAGAGRTTCRARRARRLFERVRPGEPDQAALNENATYEWDTDRNVSIVINRSSYKGVYDASNTSTLELYERDELGTENNLQISALRYRYENGTIIDSNSSALSVEQTRERTILGLPNDSSGQVAFTSERHGKQFTTPVFVDGSTAVRLPANARVGVPLLSQVSPGNYETSVDEDGYMTVVWDDVSSQSLRVRWYLQRDLLLFTGVAVVAIVVGSGGALYYRQILQLKRRREESAIDVDGDDDPRDRGRRRGCAAGFYLRPRYRSYARRAGLCR